MKSTHRAVRLAVGLTTGLALALLGSSPAVAGAARGGVTTTSATWTLVDYQQSACITSSIGRTTYFLVVIQGSWSRPITPAAQNLPAGSQGSTSAPIPPGSNYSGVVQSMVWVGMPPTPVGVYTAAIRASDGVTTQTVPLTLRVQASC